MRWENAWNVARLLLFLAGVALAVPFRWVGVGVVGLAVALHGLELFASRRQWESRLLVLEAQAKVLAEGQKKDRIMLEGLTAARKPGF